MEPILKVSGLTKTFSRQGQADFTAVQNIGFDLFPGECLAIIGESGSGKTTAVNPAQKDSQSGIENKSKNPDLSESEMDEIYRGDR